MVTTCAAPMPSRIVSAGCARDGAMLAATAVAAPAPRTVRRVYCATFAPFSSSLVRTTIPPRQWTRRTGSPAIELRFRSSRVLWHSFGQGQANRAPRGSQQTAHVPLGRFDVAALDGAAYVAVQ